MEILKNLVFRVYMFSLSKVIIGKMFGFGNQVDWITDTKRKIILHQNELGTYFSIKDIMKGVFYLNSFEQPHECSRNSL